MDWLRSEDLKEEKKVTTPTAIIAVHALCHSQQWRSVPLGMHRMNPENVAPDHSIADDIFLREEPEEEEEEDENNGKDDGDDDEEGGYSE
jgi:hypothetical protein